MKDLLVCAGSEANANELTQISMELATGERWLGPADTRDVNVTIVAEPRTEWAKQVDAIESPFVDDYDNEEYTNRGLQMLNLAEFRLIADATGVDLSWDSTVRGDLLGKRWLEIGCGTGRIAVFGAALGAKVTALDQTTGYVMTTANKMRRLPSILPSSTLLVTPAEDFKPEQQFDVVTSMFGVANHFEDWRTGLSNVSKAVAAGGKLILSMYGSPNAAVYDELSKGLPYQPAILTRRTPGGILLGDSADQVLPAAFPYPREVLECLEQNGLEIETMQPFLGATSLYPREPKPEAIAEFIATVERRYGPATADILRPFASSPQQLLVASLYADYQIPLERCDEAAYFGVVARKVRDEII